jgi:hypothetical protein
MIHEAQRTPGFCRLYNDAVARQAKGETGLHVVLRHGDWEIVKKTSDSIYQGSSAVIEVGEERISQMPPAGEYGPAQAVWNKADSLNAYLSHALLPKQRMINGLALERLEVSFTVEGVITFTVKGMVGRFDPIATECRENYPSEFAAIIDGLLSRPINGMRFERVSAPKWERDFALTFSVVAS